MGTRSKKGSGLRSPPAFGSERFSQWLRAVEKLLTDIVAEALKYRCMEREVNLRIC
jgi:hypothetical protein